MKFNKTCSQTLLPKYVQLYAEHLEKGLGGWDHTICQRRGKKSKFLLTTSCRTFFSIKAYCLHIFSREWCWLACKRIENLNRNCVQPPVLKKCREIKTKRFNQLFKCILLILIQKSIWTQFCTSIARLRFITSVPAVLNLKFGTKEAHFFLLFPAQRIPSRAKYYAFASSSSGSIGVFKFKHK